MADRCYLENNLKDFNKEFNMCQSVILSTKGNTTVSYCIACKSHYIWQNSFLLTFNANQYESFLHEVKEKIGVEEFYAFPDGNIRTMLTTPVYEIVFIFTEDEWQDFTDTLSEAHYMRQVYQLIH